MIIIIIIINKRHLIKVDVIEGNISFSELTPSRARVVRTFFAPTNLRRGDARVN